MRKIFLTLFVIVISLKGYSQEVNTENGLEKSLFNIQIGTLGVWVNNDTRIAKKIALRSEIGLDCGFFKSKVTNISGFIMVPSIGFEPRLYYNLNKRIEKEKNTKNNAFNFVTISFTYFSDLFVISNNKNTTINNQLLIIPKWGIRRNIGNSNFNYEIGIGLGNRTLFYSKNVKNEAALDLHARIGYKF